MPATNQVLRSFYSGPTQLLDLDTDGARSGQISHPSAVRTILRCLDHASASGGQPGDVGVAVRAVEAERHSAVDRTGIEDHREIVEFKNGHLRVAERSRPLEDLREPCGR